MAQKKREPDEIAVTPAMIEAGVEAYARLDIEDERWQRIVTDVYRAMADAAMQGTRDVCACPRPASR